MSVLHQIICAAKASTVLHQIKPEKQKYKKRV